MKTRFTSILIICSFFAAAQDCAFTASETATQGDLRQTILNGENNVLNQLHIKTGIGPDGSMDSRTYAPLIYSSNIWAGGLDPNSNVKFAAGMYDKQDWSPGPLDDYGQPIDDQCDFWDQVFSFTKEDVMKAREVFLADRPCSEIPESILNWPARGNPFVPEIGYLRGSDFFDYDQDGQYDPCAGDIPTLKIRGCEPYSLEEALSTLPAQVSFYKMNDAGSTHPVTQATPVQLSVDVYNFSFKSPEADNIIFTKYKYTNLATDEIVDFRFGNWLDFDLGCPQNDFLGTDEVSGMLFAYNADESEDCQEAGLSTPLPMIGTKYLRGQRAPFVIEYDDDGNITLVEPSIGSGLVDTLVSVGISNIVVPNNCFSQTLQTNCNPQIAPDFYNSINGQYFDGTSIVDDTGNPVEYMFEGNPSDANSQALCNDPNTLLETTALMSLGKIFLQPSATNEVITTTFVTKDAEYPCPDLAPLKYKESIAQSLFDNCFFNYMTPSAPLLSVDNSDSEITISISAVPTDYEETVIQAAPGEDNKYEFEGVKIYQVASQNFDLTELNNPDYSQLVYQGDIVNDITDISNFKATFSGSDLNYVSENKVAGANEGVISEVKLDIDFLTNTPIQSGIEYYYVAISYAYNNYRDFDTETSFGQQYPYMETNCGIKVVSSNMTSSNQKTPFEAGQYKFVFYNNMIRISDLQVDLELQLISIDGRILQNWELKKGINFESPYINENLPSGLYIINVSANESGLNGTHKIVVVD